MLAKFVLIFDVQLSLLTCSVRLGRGGTQGVVQLSFKWCGRVDQDVLGPRLCNQHVCNLSTYSQFYEIVRDMRAWCLQAFHVMALL